MEEVLFCPVLYFFAAWFLFAYDLLATGLTELRFFCIGNE